MGVNRWYNISLETMKHILGTIESAVAQTLSGVSPIVAVWTDGVVAFFGVASWGLCSLLRVERFFDGQTGQECRKLPRTPSSMEKSHRPPTAQRWRRAVNLGAEGRH